MNSPITALKERGILNVVYLRDVRSAVEEAVEAWKKFCALPTVMKNALPTSSSADGVGYELKDGVGQNADRKENFDYAAKGNAWIDGNLGNFRNRESFDFVTKARLLVKMIKPLILKFAREVEEEYGIKGFAEEVDGGDDAFFIRFIHYFGDRAVGEETAAAHVDQSGFTLHLYESAPGFQCFTYDGKWIDVSFPPGETVIIPSMQLQLRSDGRLRAMCHRVVATEETARDGRYSAVCFVQLKNTLKYDKAAYGRLQEKLVGFNYDMPIAEFAKMFK